MTTSLERLEAWFRSELPRLNRGVLFDKAPPTTVRDALREAVLPHLPDPGGITTLQAQRLVIGLGLAGSSVARHHQEAEPGRKSEPERSFDGLVAGPARQPFPDYFAALADRTGTGHYHRDAYASLVLWNVPTTELRWRGRSLATLPGVYPDGNIRSYTGDTGEKWFFELVKQGQTIEAGINVLLEPLAEPGTDLTSEDALRRVRLARVLLGALRQLFLDFAAPQPGRGMQPQYFMDVFRQYAVHWRPGDIPPSGALDVDSLKRDFLLGIAMPGYRGHVERIKPALLADERAALDRLMDRPPLPAVLLGGLGLDEAALAELSPAAVRALTVRHPPLVDWYLLLSAHARAAGAHLMLSKRFLFKPQRHRDESGIGDRELVSNRRGTTGMDESFLDRITRIRRAHLLAPLQRGQVAADPTDAAAISDVEVVMLGRDPGGAAPQPRDQRPEVSARSALDRRPGAGHDRQAGAGSTRWRAGDRP